MVVVKLFAVEEVCFIDRLLKRAFLREAVSGEALLDVCGATR